MGFFATKQTGETIRTVGAISTVGLSFVLAIVIGAWLGRVLDGRLGTAPIFFIVCFFLGLAAGILNVYRTVSRAFPPSRPTGAPPPVAPPRDDDDLRQGDD
jgi:F0F1-type ATP synthase assembly protein I